MDPNATAAAWATVQALAGTLHGRPSSTIERRGAADAGGDALLERLGRDRARGLHVHETLGEGGMGLVRRAHQPTLDREVAVKSIRPGRRNDTAIAKILQEAWVLGRLDHPNIVPIHDIELDDEGIPRIVMKRIEGRSLAELLESPDEIETQDSSDLLEWKLRVLAQVCNAVAYAHARGILHLDIKPDNIMVGRFGEVYLMDWGIAMSFGEGEQDERIPAASDCREILGTPNYIAPEMLEADGSKLGPATDVYLLGATLYEFLVGETPHRGASIMNIMHDALSRAPRVPEGVDAPPSLVQLVERCLALDPAARPDSAKSLRDGLFEVLAHRDAQRLCDEAVGRIRSMEEAIAAGAEAREVYDHLAAARFAFEAALERQADDARARAGRRDAVARVIEWELGREQPAAAAALLAGVDGLDPALVARVESAQREAKAKAERLAQLELDQDPRIGQRTRLFIISIMGTVWTTTPILAHLHLGPDIMESQSDYTMMSVAFLLALLGFGVWARESLTKTAFNRRLGLTLALLFVAQIGMIQLADFMALSVAQTLSLNLFLYAFTALLTALYLDRRLLVTAIAYALALVGASIWPGVRLFFLAAGNLVLTLNLLWVWRLPLDELRRPREGRRAGRLGQGAGNSVV